MTDTAIARVEAIAFDEGQPLLQESGLVVEWRHDQDIDDFEYEKDYVLPAGDPAEIAFDAADYDPVDDDEVERVAAALDGMGLGDAIDGAIVRGTEADRGAVVRRCRRGLLVLNESARWDVDRERLVVALEIAVRACESRGVTPVVEMSRLSSPVDADGAPVRATSD